MNFEGIDERAQAVPVGREWPAGNVAVFEHAVEDADLTAFVIQARSRAAGSDKRGPFPLPGRYIDCDGVSFGDSPLRTAGSMMQSVHRWSEHGGSPKTWLEKFCLYHMIGERDRTYIELSALIEAFWMRVTYDQLDVGGVAIAECLKLRILAITEAYNCGRGDTPDWSSSTYFSEVQGGHELVCPEMRVFDNKQAKSDVERGPAGEGEQRMCR